MTRTLKRRRAEARTDYRTRLTLLKSGKPRLVIRKTNKYIIAQLIESKQAQDFVICGVSSKDLLSKVWPKDAAGSLKSLPAGYLTGFLIGSNKKHKIKEAILDLGMHRNISKSRIYAVVKGAIDAGLSIPCAAEVLPTLEEISKNPKVGKLISLKEKMK